MTPKTLEENASYTPVVFPGDGQFVFESSLPSLASTSWPPAGGTSYLANLSRKHKAMAHITREEPASPPQSQAQSAFDLSEDHEQAQEDRIAALRTRVGAALSAAQGNPADGNWVFLARLLRMGATRGRRAQWAGARYDVRAPAEMDGPGLGWVNAATDKEWEEWEQRYWDERRVKDKVELWKRGVEPPSKDPSLLEPTRSNEGTVAQSKPKPTNLITVTSTSASIEADPLRDAAPFGFGVVKRSTLKNLAGSKPGSQQRSSQANSKKGPTEPVKKSTNEDAQPELVIPAAAKDDVRHIADVSDFSFPPPSFPSSQLITSTPKAQAQTNAIAEPPFSFMQPSFSSSQLITSTPKAQTNDNNAKPQSATHTKPNQPFDLLNHQPAPPPSSPKMTRAYGGHLNQSPEHRPLATSASLSMLPPPTTPTRNNNNQSKRPLPTTWTPITDDVIEVNDESERPLKKARTMPPSPHTPKPKANVGSLPLGIMSPHTPKRGKNRAVPDQILTAFWAPPRTPVAEPAPPSSSLLSPPPSTPPQAVEGGKRDKERAVPTLTELLASTRRSKERGRGTKNEKGKDRMSMGNDKGKGKGKLPTALPVAAKAGEHQASAGGAALPAAPARKDADAKIPDDEEADVQENVHHQLFVGQPEPEPEHQQVADVDPYAHDPHYNYNYNGYDDNLHGQLDPDLESPTKSLSSLAGTDSEEEEDELGDDGDEVGAEGFSFFKPLATSTQKEQHQAGGEGHASANEPDQDQGASQATRDSWASVYAPLPSSNHQPPPPLSSNPSIPALSNPNPNSNPFQPPTPSPYRSYNSQFEAHVAREVDKVDQLLERELDYGYEAWVRDPDEVVGVGVGDRYNGGEESP